MIATRYVCPHFIEIKVAPTKSWNNKHKGVLVTVKQYSKQGVKTLATDFLLNVSVKGAMQSAKKEFFT